MSEARTTLPPSPLHQPLPLHLSPSSPLRKRQLHHLATTPPCLRPPVPVIGQVPRQYRCSQLPLPALRFPRRPTLTQRSSVNLSRFSRWHNQNLEVARQLGRNDRDSLLKMTMVRLLPLAATTSRRSWMTDLSTTRGRPRGRGAKTLVVELPLVESPGAGTRVCREQAAGKGLQWSRALVTLNPRPGPLMASVWKATTQPRTGPGTARPMGQLVSTSNCPPRTRSGSEAFSKKSHISELRQRELRAST